MTDTLILKTLIMVDEDGHMTSFTLHSQKNDIVDFIISNQNHKERFETDKSPTQLKLLDYEEFLEFLHNHILARGLAELSHINYTETEEDPF